MPIVRQQDKLDSQRVFVQLPWLGSASLALKRRIFKLTNDAIPLCAPVCVFTSKKMFHTNREDVLSADNLSNVVYLFSCACGHSYFGRTTLRLGERIRQHIPAEMTNHVATHAVSPVRENRGQLKKSSPTTLRKSQRLAQKEQVLSAVKPDLPAVQMALRKSDSAITRHLKVPRPV